MQLWRVVGGKESGGLLVRDGADLSTANVASVRLSAGAVVRELELNGTRLHYKKNSGEGPNEGWISVRTRDRILARRIQEVESPTSASMDNIPTVAGSIDPGSNGAKVRNQRALSVRIHNLAGEEMTTLTMPMEATGIALKEAMFDVCQTPCDLQRLVIGEHILEDGDFLRAFSDAAGMLEIQFVRVPPATSDDGKAVLQVVCDNAPDKRDVYTVRTTVARGTVRADLLTDLDGITALVEASIGVAAGEQRIIIDGVGVWDDDRRVLADILKPLGRPPRKPVQTKILRMAEESVALYRQVASGRQNGVDLLLQNFRQWHADLRAAGSS